MGNLIYAFLDAVILIVMMCIVENKILIKKNKRIGIAISLIVGVSLISNYIVEEELFLDIINILLTAVVSYIVCNPQTTKFVSTYLISLFIVALLQAVTEFLIPSNMLNPITIEIVMLIVVVGFGAVIKLVIKKSLNFDIIPKKSLLGIAIMIFALIFVMTGILVYTQDMGSGILAKVLAGTAIIVCLAVVGVALQSISAQISKINLEKEKDMLQRYNEQQKAYYELILKSEEDTRRFRHDMVNHMFCLENYLEEGKIDECRAYISNITNSLNYSRKKIYYTGNRICDVMLTNILENKKDDVEVAVTGRLRDDISISDFDLCVVVSNIVKNAVEAVNRQNAANRKYIKIDFTMGKRYLRIEERNSIDAEQIENAKRFETTKEDKKAHGLGVKNVKMIVEKYNGCFKSEVLDDEFYVCVEIDMKKKV